MGLEDLMELLNLVKRLKVSILGHKELHRRELIRLYIVKQGPKLRNIVLNRGSSEQNDLLAGVFFEQFESFGLFILEPVCFINHYADKRQVDQDIV
jgi:hypothetical protein